MGTESYPKKSGSANYGKLFKRTNTGTYGVKGVDGGKSGNYGTKGVSSKGK